MSICSCKGCIDRYLGCHSNCEKYKAYRKEKDETNERRQKLIKEDTPFYDAKAKNIRKKLKTKGKF